MLREWEFNMAQLANLGFIPGECHIAGAGAQTPYGFWRDDRRVPANRLHTSISDAYVSAGVKNGNNNVIFVTPDSHSQGAALTFNKNMTHVVGMYPPGVMNLRARLGHSVTVSPMLTLSGYGNLLKNLYFMHGAAATDLIGMQITGERNMLENVHIGGPMAALQSAEATYATLDLTGCSESYFKNCTFGTDTIARSAANCVLRIGAGSVRNTFEDCTFLMHSSAGTSYFINVLVGSTFSWTMFKNCRFITTYGTAATVGILNSSVAYGHKLLFDSQCAMFGATDAIAEAGQASVLQGNGGFCAADEDILLSTAYDHTA